MPTRMRYALLPFAPPRGNSPAFSRFTAPRTPVGGVPHREWRLLGDLGGHGEDLTEEPPVLIHRGDEAPVTQAVTQFLSACGARQRDWDFYRYAVQAASPPVELGKGRFVSDPALQYRQWETMRGSVLVDLPDAWEAFRKTLSRSMRDNLCRIIRANGQSLGITWKRAFWKRPMPCAMPCRFLSNCTATVRKKARA